MTGGGVSGAGVTGGGVTGGRVTGGGTTGDVVRAAMVGCGAIARWHLDSIERATVPISVTAAVDPVTERARSLAERARCDWYPTLEAAIGAGEVDAAIVAVPHDRHEEVATRALARGLHVLLEKPLAPTVEAARRILDAAEAARAECGAVFMVAENAQYWPEVRTVRRLIEEGAVGEVVTARAATFFPALDDFYGPQSSGAVEDGTERRPWRFDRQAAGGGVVIDTGSHWLRPLRRWLGEADEVVAALGYRHPGMEGESLCRALIRFASGTVAAFDAMLATGPVSDQPLFTVTGTEGELTVGGSGWVTLWDGTDPRGTRIGERGGYLLSYEGQFADFARAVLEGSAPEAPAEDAMGELRLALAMYRSAETGRWEKVWA